MPNNNRRWQISPEIKREAGERAPAGVYFVHFEAGAVRETRKVV